jgi:hypothetical protein
MAIVIEEEKSRVNLVNLGGWVVVLGVLGAAVYYLFFVAPEFVIVSPPADFQTITPIAQVSLHPEDVLNSASFQSLKSPSFALPDPHGPNAVGRGNPFIAP